MEQPLEQVSFDKPGELTSLPPGHDAWVIGDEPVVAVDRQGASVWAKAQ